MVCKKKNSNIYTFLPPRAGIKNPLLSSSCTLSLTLTQYFPTTPLERTLIQAFLISNLSRSFQTNLFHTILHKLSTMLYLNSRTAATTVFALLSLINSITALPTHPHPTSQSPPGKLDPSTIKIHLDGHSIGSSYPPRYDESGSPTSGQLKAFLAGKYGPESATKLLLTPPRQKKTAATATPTTTTTVTTAASYRKGRSRILVDRNDDNKNESSSDNTNKDNNKKSKDETPLVRIFTNGAFLPFTPEEGQEFLLLQKAQGQVPPKVVVDKTIKEIHEDNLKKSSVYNKTRICEKSGDWCKLPPPGSLLIVGPGVGPCTYYKADEKKISYTTC